MKYGFLMPIMDARAIVDYACETEQAGWDGFFVCESWWSIDFRLTLPGKSLDTRQDNLKLNLATMPIC